MRTWVLNSWTLGVALLSGCSAGQLERTDDAPLTQQKADQYNAEAGTAYADGSSGLRSQPIYTRYDLGKMTVVNLGFVIDAGVVELTGTTQSGQRTGAAAGGLNAINSGTTSTESIVLRVLGGALVGAAIESSLTSGQAFEYLIRRDDGAIISTLNRSRLNIGDCLKIRTDPSNARTLLEVKPSRVCENGFPSAQASAEPVAAADIVNVEQPKPASQEPVKAARTGYWIDLSASRSGDNVTFLVATSIPGAIDVMASLDLKGQKPRDVHIGKTERIRIDQGEEEFKLSTDDLPPGQYEARVTFYPRWGFQDTESRATGISQEISAHQDIYLGAKGISAAEAQFRDNSQRWIMENVIGGYLWDEAAWVSKYGDYRKIPVQGLNPDVIHAYYFDRLDMTIFVNVPRRSVSHWRLGKASR